MKRSLSLASGALFGAVLLSGSVAQAHIDMLGALKSRGGDQKQVPCDGARSAGMVYTFEPGAVITIGVTENVEHPSYFRIAFDRDGQDFVEPASIDPIDPNRAGAGKKCMDNANDKCGKTDFCNTPDVLWDNVDPHLGNETAGTYTWTIKLPDVECTNCTLQVLQVMEDTVHQEYCPQGSCAKSCGLLCDVGGLQDIYHRCINVTLKKGAGTSGPGNAPGAAVKVGTIGAKYPNANKNCAGASTSTGDAGTSLPDSGAGQSDAAMSGDAAATGAAGGVGGTVGGSTPGTMGGGAPGGAAGTAGGGTSGAAGGTAGGGVPNNPGGTAAGTSTGGTAGTGTSGTAGTGGTTGGIVAPSPDDDDGGCSLSPSTQRDRATAWAGLTLLGVGVLGYRRRKHT